MLLGEGAGLLDRLGSLGCARAQLLGLVLDLLVQALEGREDAVLDVLFAVEVHVDNALGVVAHVLKQPGNSASAGAEVVAFLEGLIDSL